MKNKITTIILLFLLSLTLQAKTEYKIEIEFVGETDSVIILANYYGNTFQVVDTIPLINQRAIITGDEPLKQGVYALARLNKSKYFDFVIGAYPFFSIQAHTNNLVDSITAYNSTENSAFFKYIQLNSKLFHINQESQQAQTNPNNTKKLEMDKEGIFQEILSLKEEVHKKIPKSVLDLIFTSMEEPKIPKNIAADKQKSYQYFKSNYWNLIALDDDRMLRTPVFQRKYEFFFDRIVLQQADTLIREIDKLFEKDIDPEIYKYLIWDLTLKYEEPKIMGLDQVFVHIVDHYYKKGNVKDFNQSIVDNIIERAEKVRPLLIGKIAPNLIMVDTTAKFDALNNYFTKDYTIILFWESDCQTCQKEIKELQKLHHSNKFNFDVFAIGTDDNIKLWKKYIAQNKLDWINVNGTRSLTADYHDLYNIYSTPTIFILDKNKKIIGKKISVGQIEGFLNNYENFHKNEPTP